MRFVGVVACGSAAPLGVLQRDRSSSFHVFFLESDRWPLISARARVAWLL
jgi:hypothetical protein